jgi:hypothetical protein
MKRYGIKDYDELLQRALEDPDWFWDELAGNWNGSSPIKMF